MEQHNLTFNLGKAGKPIIEIFANGEAYVNGRKCDDNQVLGQMVRKMVIVQNHPKAHYTHTVNNDFVEFLMPRFEFNLSDFINDGQYSEVEHEDVLLEKVATSQNGSGIITKEPVKVPGKRVVCHFKRK